MEHKASPRRRAGAGDRQGVRELWGEQRSLLERSLSAAVPICSCAPAGKDVSLQKSPFSFAQAFAGACALVPSYEGGSAHLRAGGQAGYFQALKLGGGGGAERSARMANVPAPSPSACQGTLPSLTCCAQLFCGIRKCTWQPVMRGGPFILRLVPRRKWE